MPTETELALQALLKPQGLSPELLIEVLQWRLTKPDCDRGVVLDGLDSRLAAKGEKDGAAVGERWRTGAVSAEAASVAMPGARLLVLRFKGKHEGCVTVES